MSRFIGEKVLMRVFVGEAKRYGHRQLYEVLVDLFMAEGFAGATVLKGVAGFGAHRVFHTHKLLELSTDLPVIIEVVESQEKIDAIMPRVDEIMESGMITLEKATVIRYTHKHAGE